MARGAPCSTAHAAARSTARFQRDRSPIGLCALAACLACVSLTGAAAQAFGARQAQQLRPPVALHSIPTDHYLDLGAQAPVGTPDPGYTPAGAPWSRPEPFSEAPAPLDPEHRYVDLGRLLP